MNSIYTMEQWQKDGKFKAEAGQEIDSAVYEEMLYCMPPEKLPKERTYQFFKDFKIYIAGGFLMGEPYGMDKDGNALYLAFGNTFMDGDKKFYFIGLSSAKHCFKE